MRFDEFVSEKVRGLLPENDQLDCHFWSDFLNFDARSINSANDERCALNGRI